MGELGLQAYRFSIAWPRIYPQGDGPLNLAGLDFYDRLVDDLLAAGIRPFVTLYHWDLPQALQDRGGWANRETVEHYRRYVDTVSERLGDRVQHWITHNEPWVAAAVGNLYGLHAPGLKDLETAMRVSHHLLLSHGVAVPVLRANSAAGTQVGITLNLYQVYPASESPAGRAAWCRVYPGAEW
jgi:beta-glucosidase